MINNNDEAIDTGIPYANAALPHVTGIGNFHKTLPHNRFGEVEPAAYKAFADIASTGGDYELVAHVPAPAKFDRLNNPQAARSHDKLTGPPASYSMPPAPSVLSETTAAEMTELQWMAILRDVPFVEFDTNAQVTAAIGDIRSQYQRALNAHNPGGLELGVDLPKDAAGKLDVAPRSVFRCGLKEEDVGPIVSQFFLHDIGYGAQFIHQQVRGYARGLDFLTDYDSWLHAQNTGLDAAGHGYAKDNDFVSAAPEGDMALARPGPLRHLATMRDVARFVNKDALHQAYFNAALQCLNWNIPFDAGNPYGVGNPSGAYKRQAAFGTFGGPDLLTRVSEVAGRALAVVWRQKWEVHRRLRPEAYGGLMQMQYFGLADGAGHVVKRPYGLPAMAFDSVAAQQMRQIGHKNLFLPIAFTAGSPPHPSYGAGHATVAGACVTVLKAWLQEDMKIADLFGSGAARHPANDAPLRISVADAYGQLVDYREADAGEMTVGGELNKLACNVAMGRSMGGVHWRSDNTRSLRLGEKIAVELLRSESEDYAEVFPDGTKPSWSFTSFNGNPVKIQAGVVNGNPGRDRNDPL